MTPCNPVGWGVGEGVAIPVGLPQAFLPIPAHGIQRRLPHQVRGGQPAGFFPSPGPPRAAVLEAGASPLVRSADTLLPSTVAEMSNHARGWPGLPATPWGGWLA